MGYSLALFVVLGSDLSMVTICYDRHTTIGSMCDTLLL